MNRQAFNRFCKSLPATTHVVQWGGAHVWKVGGKVFAIAHFDDGTPAITFKVSETSYEILQARRGLRPAPYLASRGLKWIQHHAKPGLTDAALKDYIRQSHVMVAQGLPKRSQIALGLAPSESKPRPEGKRCIRRLKRRVSRRRAAA